MAVLVQVFAALWLVTGAICIMLLVLVKEQEEQITRHYRTWRREHLIRDYMEAAIEELIGHEMARTLIKEAIYKAQDKADSLDQ